jgi:hypothetical protein
MKKITILALSLCSIQNITLVANATTNAIPIAHEIAISKLLAKISILEARLDSLSWVDYVRIPWICLSAAYYLSSFTKSEISTLSPLQTKWNAIYTLFPLILFETLRFRDNRMIPLLYRQIEQLRSKNI